MSINEKDEDIEFFDGLKKVLLKLCDSKFDIPEFQKFKEKLGASSSFDELVENTETHRK